MDIDNNETKSIIEPKEFNLDSDNYDKHFEGKESHVRILKLRRNDDNSSTRFAYKKGRFYSEDDTETLLTTVTEAQQHALERKRQYENFVICFGSEFVAETHFTVGEDVISNNPEVHTIQEPLDMTIEDLMGMNDVALPSEQYNQRFVEALLRIKRANSIDDLNDDDPFEKIVKQRILENKSILTRFYKAYQHSILLGFVPDLQGFHPTGNYADDDNLVLLGLLFNTNVGVKQLNGHEIQIKMFDFGYPSFNVLTLESRRRLQNLIHERGENPIDEKQKVLADWYKSAIKHELEQMGSAVPRDYQPHGIKTIDGIISHIESLLFDESKGYNWTNRYEYRDLDVFRRLLGIK